MPFLLKHGLREYQHIGLDWLVTMNEQKLNGILADEMVRPLAFEPARTQRVGWCPLEPPAWGLEPGEVVMTNSFLVEAWLPTMSSSAASLGPSASTLNVEEPRHLHTKTLSEGASDKLLGTSLWNVLLQNLRSNRTAQTLRPLTPRPSFASEAL